MPRLVFPAVALCLAVIAGCAPAGEAPLAPPTPPDALVGSSCAMVGTPTPAVLGLLVKARADRAGLTVARAK